VQFKEGGGGVEDEGSEEYDMQLINDILFSDVMSPLPPTKPS